MNNGIALVQMLETLLQGNQKVLGEILTTFVLKCSGYPVCSETALATASSWQEAEPTSGWNLLGLWIQRMHLKTAELDS